LIKPAQAPVGTVGAGGAAKALAAAKIEIPTIRDEKIFIEFPFGVKCLFFQFRRLQR
jgi:hypothetical protein